MPILQLQTVSEEQVTESKKYPPVEVRQALPAIAEITYDTKPIQTLLLYYLDSETENDSSIPNAEVFNVNNITMSVEVPNIKTYVWTAITNMKRMMNKENAKWAVHFSDGTIHAVRMDSPPHFITNGKQVPYPRIIHTFPSSDLSMIGGSKRKSKSPKQLGFTNAGKKDPLTGKALYIKKGQATSKHTRMYIKKKQPDGRFRYIMTRA